MNNKKFSILSLTDIELGQNLFLFLHRAFLKFTDYHTPTNALLYIVLV
jgi:hypothetical protein